MPAIGDALEAEVDDPGGMRRERDRYKRSLKEAQDELITLRERAAFLDAVEELRPKPPRWVERPAKGGHKAILVALCSDWHFDEVVSPVEMNGVNAYNRDIALLRFERWAQKVVDLAHNHLSGVEFEGMVAAFLGDLVTGEIHEELAKTNAAPILDTLRFWSEHLAAAIDLFADQFGKVHVPWIVGNHGRRQKKNPSKGQVRDNYEWLLGHIVAREFRGDNRVTFQIPEAPEVVVPIYGTNVLFVHGHQGFSGGNGIAGIWPPLMRGHAKRRGVHEATNQPFDFMCIGHFHQLTWGQGWIVNGSGKGYDEWTRDMGFGFEVPQQGMFLVTPEHGPTARIPVFVADRKKEGW